MGANQFTCDEHLLQTVFSPDFENLLFGTRKIDVYRIFCFLSKSIREKQEIRYEKADYFNKKTDRNLKKKRLNKACF